MLLWILRQVIIMDKFILENIFDDIKGNVFTGNAETICGVFQK